MKMSGWILAILAGPSALGCEFENDERRFAEECEPPAVVQPAPRHVAFSVAACDFEVPSAPPARLAVERLWNGVQFVSPGGRDVQYRAVIDAEYGTIVIDLRPDWAPNHVRHFVALARAGFCDGLSFAPAHDPVRRATIPLTVQLDYRIRPEAHAPLRLEPGMIGFAQPPAKDNAAPRFYINLGPTPDTETAATAFGEVVLGIDALHRMNASGQSGCLRSVTIQAREITP